MKVFNFSAGPAVLPAAVLERAAAEMTDWRGSGMSVMEMSHRGKEFIAIADKAEADLRELLGVSSDYKVLFLQGGATTQFAVVPLNLAAEGAVVDYVATGEWSAKAIKEAQRFCQVDVVASGEQWQFTRLPAPETWRCNSGAAYLHYTSNETIGGVEFQSTPSAPPGVPLVCDMSSNILSRPVDVSRFGVIYAGAQKNIGPAGLTVVIIRQDLLGRAGKKVPSMLDYKVQADNGSMYNTPPSYAIYIAGLVFEWIKDFGGLVAIEQHNVAKAKLLYDFLDAGSFYRSPVAGEHRSRMNIPFRLHDDALDEAFLKFAKARGLEQLKGHRSVGGMRASIYNAMPKEGVLALVDCMREFERQHG